MVGSFNPSCFSRRNYARELPTEEREKEEEDYWRVTLWQIRCCEIDPFDKRR